jgi:NitT/TauT family transport system ATP-binding protein
MPPAPPLCEVKDVFQDFRRPSGQTLRVLEGVSLSVNEHEVVALLGPSGCGKSTVLRILAGLIPPTEGAVTNRGAALTGLNDDVAMVFQSFALYPWMTARENIEAVLRAQGMAEDKVKERADQVIKVVGLTGFANSFPREMSGGMKQRIGIARAISVDRKLLFMDEPFSQVDALTAESLRSEVLDLWAPADRNPSSILMVSHDIKEVVYMADRIVIFGANPGRIRKIIDNKLPRPRDYRSPGFLQLVDHIHDIITGMEMPDAAPLAASASASTSAAPASEIEQLPPVLPGEIVGLIEYLEARRGQEDVFRIATDTAREFGEIISVVKAAEVLDLVDTPKRLVVLTPEGRRFAKALAEERRSIWRSCLMSLQIIKTIYAMIARQPDHQIDREIIEETIILAMPHEDYARQFNTIMAWARFCNLFSFDEVSEKVSLSEGNGNGNGASTAAAGTPPAEPPKP